MKDVKNEIWNNDSLKKCNEVLENTPDIEKKEELELLIDITEENIAHFTAKLKEERETLKYLQREQEKYR